MKKSLLIIQIITVCSFFATAAFASGGDRGHHKGHHKNRHDHYRENDGYAQPQPRNYAPQPYQDPRSHQGLAGGVVGSVLGYEIGKGDPVATGLGAAAGSYIGNGISGRR